MVRERWEEDRRTIGTGRGKGSLGEDDGKKKR